MIKRTKIITCVLFSILLIVFVYIIIVKQNTSIFKSEQVKIENIDKTVYIHEINITSALPNRDELLSALFSVLDQMVKEKIPFDEPRKEVGQQDGELRPLWKTAWRKGKGRYYHNGNIYYSQDNDGNPLPPQVCIDFIVDSFDRMGGNWWFKYNKKGIRVDEQNSLSKTISSQLVADDKTLDKRRIIDVITFFDLYPDLFQKIIREENNGPQIGDTDKIKTYFNFYNVEPGDIIFILGRAKWDNYNALHYHSFFIRTHTDSDWTIIGNSVMVAERNLVTELKRTPRRKIWAIYRPSNKLLYNIINKRELKN